MAANPRLPTWDGDRFEFAPHHCFGCGTLNTNGLRMLIHIEPGRSWADLELDRRYEGWEGIAHGGITCTILDEVMAWAMVGEDNWGFTARISVDFKKPIPIGVAIRADGWITRSRRRLVDTSARIIDVGSGVHLARATGVYLAVGAARKRELKERYGFRRIAPNADEPPR